MFDSREIAEKALIRIEQINQKRRRKRHSAVMIGATLCISVTGLLLFNTPTDHDNEAVKIESRIVHIEEPAIPLARPPTETTEICAKCGKEIEEKQDNEEETEETEELCEQCTHKP